jgi:hypothetical protein
MTLTSEQAREDLRRLSTRDRWDALAGIIAEKRLAIAQAKADLLYAEQWLTEEMQNQEPPAIEVATDRWRIKVKSSQTYSYDDEALSELQGYLTPDEYDQVVERVSYLKWSKVALNKLHRAGGILARVIDKGVVVASKRTDLEIGPR